MSNSLTITFTNNPSGIFYPNQVVSGEKNEKLLEIFHQIDFLSFIGSVELKVVEAIKKARGMKDFLNVYPS